MRIELERPIFLVLFAVLGVVIWYVSKCFSKGDTGKKIVVGIRIFLVFLIVLALCAPKIVIFSHNTTTIYLADLSDSNRINEAKMERFIKESINLKKPNESQAVVVFAKDAQIQTVASPNPNFSEFEMVIDGTQTNIENAIRYAAKLFEKDSRKRLVLLTDGKETAGQVKNAADILKDEKVDVKVVDFSENGYRDVQFSSLKLPAKVSKNQELSIFANITSNISTNATLKIYRDQHLILNQNVVLENGENRFVIKDKLIKEGVYKYQGIVEAQDDEIDKNNVAYAACQVKKPQKVLVIYQDKKDLEVVRNLLDSSSYSYDIFDASSVNFGLEKLIEYSFVIFCNVSKDMLNDQFLKTCEKYVKDLGGGIITIGGENSYALGNYSNSPLENILPVRMQAKNKEQKGKVDVVLVLDSSGSMSAAEGSTFPKIDIAKVAATKMVENLELGDNVGVLTFSHQFYWVHKFGKMTSKDIVKNDISTIEAGGGTAIIPPLKEAINILKKSKTNNKIIILLTDGMGESSGYEMPVIDAKNNDIIITTIGIGESINKDILSWMAAYTNGRFYHVQNAGSLVNVFVKESKIIKGKYIKNKRFIPKQSGINQINRDFTSYPPLYGYIATSKKALATDLLESDEGEPILAVWRYGLGKAVAWCSDLSGEWSKEWVMWDKFSKIWTNVFKWVAKDAEGGNWDFEVKKGNTLSVALTGNFGSKAAAKLRCVLPNGTEKLIELKRTAADRFEANIEFIEGNYIFVAILNDEKRTYTATFFYSANYSDEYRLDSDKTGFEQFVGLVGARSIKKPSEVYLGELEGVYSKKDISDILLILCIFIFLIEVAIKRLNLYSWLEMGLNLVLATSNRMTFKNIFISFVKEKRGLLKQKNKSRIEEFDNKKKRNGDIPQTKEIESKDLLDIKKLRRL